MPEIGGRMHFINQTPRLWTANWSAVRNLTFVTVLSAVFLTLPAVAQDAQPDAGRAASEESASATEVTPLEGMVVTALKREAMIQDVPVSMTAFDSEQIDESRYAVRLRSRDYEIGRRIAGT